MEAMIRRQNALLLRNSDGDLAACVALLQIPDRTRCIAESVAAIEDRSDFTGSHEVCQEVQIGGVHFREQTGHLLGCEWSEQQAMEHGAKEFDGPAVGSSAAASDVNAITLQHTQEIGRV